MTSYSISQHARFRSTSVSDSLSKKECISVFQPGFRETSFCEVRNRIHNAEKKLYSAAKTKAMRKYFEEFTAILNEEFYCQVYCCIVKYEKRFC